MTCLFVDPATTCGMAVGMLGFIVASDLELKVEDEPFAARLWRLKRWLEQTHDADPITLIGYESSRFLKSADAAFCYGAIVGQLLLFALEHDIPVESVPVATLKKFWTGSGNASKQQMMAAARQRGFEPASHNEADAIAGLHWLFANFPACEPLAVPEPQPEGGEYKQAAE